jgi:hypothetical protein
MTGVVQDNVRHPFSIAFLKQLAFRRWHDAQHVEGSDRNLRVLARVSMSLINEKDTLLGRDVNTVDIEVPYNERLLAGYFLMT